MVKLFIAECKKSPPMSGGRVFLPALITAFLWTALLSSYGAGFQTLGRANISGTVLYVARPSSSGSDGNWIKLSGGFALEMPELTFKYNLTNASYVYNGTPVTLNASPSVYTVTYPYAMHSLYVNSDTVAGSFYGNSSLANALLDIYLISTSPTELKNVADSALDGDVTPFENLLSSARNKSSAYANSTGDADFSFANVPAGEYLLLVMLNKSNHSAFGLSDAEHVILSSTGLSVLDYSSQVSAPSSVTGSTIKVSVSISNTTSCTYRYGAVAIKKSAYSYTVELVSNGTRAGTNVTVNNVPVVEGFTFFGGGIGDITYTELATKVGEIIGANNGAVSLNNNASSSSKSITLTLPSGTGKYTLITGVWSYCPGEKLVALNQTSFTKKAPSPPSGGGGAAGGGAPSVPAVVCEGRGVILEPEMMDIMELLGHDFGVKFAFTRFMSPLSSLYAARRMVVMSIELAERLVETIERTEIGLTRVEKEDLYARNADYVLENYPRMDVLIIARGDLEVDSLAASPLAQILGAPILLVEPDRIPESILNVIVERQPYLQYRKIYIIGGPEAVSTKVEEELRPRARELVRLWGPTRYETAVEVAKEVLRLGGVGFPVITNGRTPVLYALTLANRYRAPILYLDKPPVRESTFKEHGIVRGSIALESFDTFQALGDKSPTYTMHPVLKTKGIKDAWMYIHTIGYDSVAEKWTVKLNNWPLAYKVHSQPVAEHQSSQLIRFDVRGYVKEGENTLSIEGTSFNVDDQYFITGVTFVLLYDSGESTEYWIGENTSVLRGGVFEKAEDAKLYALYLEGDKEARLLLNNIELGTRDVEPVHLRVATSFYTLKEADARDAVSRENLLSGDVPQLTVLVVTSPGLEIPAAVREEELDEHQAFVKSFLDEQKFDLLCMLYYESSVD